MTVVLFLSLLVILSAATSLFTEAIKKCFEGNRNYSANMVVLTVAIIVGGGGTALAYVLMGIPFDTANILCIPLMAVAVWVGAMVGYDKVIQLIEQIKML